MNLNKKMCGLFLALIGTLGSMLLAAPDEPPGAEDVSGASGVEATGAAGGEGAGGLVGEGTSGSLPASDALTVAQESPALRLNRIRDGRLAQGHGGPRVLQTLLKRYGVRVDRQQLAVESNTTPDGLNTLDDLGRTIDGHGLLARQLACTASELDSLTAANDVIGLLANHRYFILIESMDMEVVTFTHPGWAILDGPPQTLSREDFDHLWLGPCLAVSGRK